MTTSTVNVPLQFVVQWVPRILSTKHVIRRIVSQVVYHLEPHFFVSKNTVQLVFPAGSRDAAFGNWTVKLGTRTFMTFGQISGSLVELPVSEGLKVSRKNQNSN